jgi:hypothetical protein
MNSEKTVKIVDLIAIGMIVVGGYIMIKSTTELILGHIEYKNRLKRIGAK